MASNIMLTRDGAVGILTIDRRDRFNSLDVQTARDEAVRCLVVRGATASYASAKRLMNEAAGVDRLDFHLDRELELLAQSADSDDFAEGLCAFFEKRAPTFEGH
jgi:enoyl-CoA hydratase/carnithine racemase